MFTIIISENDHIIVMSMNPKIPQLAGESGNLKIIVQLNPPP